MGKLLSIVRLLADQNNTLLGEGSEAGSALNAATGTIMGTFKSIMKIVMPIVLSVVLALGVFFCLKLGISYAKAEKTEDREEAKKRLVGAVIGFGIGVVGAAVMWILFTNDSILTAIFKTN